MQYQVIKPAFIDFGDKTATGEPVGVVACKVGAVIELDEKDKAQKELSDKLIRIGLIQKYEPEVISPLSKSK